MSAHERNDLVRLLWKVALALLVIVASWSSGPALAGEGDAEALRERMSRETQALVEAERRTDAIEKHQQLTPLAGSGKASVDPRLAHRFNSVSKSPQRSSLSGPLSSAAPVNDTCLTATAIGNGTFLGTTAGAGTDDTASCGNSDFSPDVWFEYTAPSAGAVFFNTFGSSFDTVLSLYSSCGGAEIDCNDDAGSGQQSALLENVNASQVIYARVSGYGGDSGAYVLNTGLGGSISGTVTEAGSGTPIASASVTIYRAQAGQVEFMGSDPAAGDGSYTVGGLPPGDYRAIAKNSAHANELYDDILCPGGINSCFPERGAAITVVAGTDTPLIDFELAPGGSISGTVTSGGSPVTGPNVGIYDASGNFIFNDLGGGDGTYAVGGLPDGQYFVATRIGGTSSLANEVYDDVDCPGPAGTLGCPTRAGMPVTVTAPNNTPGIDFDLEPGGSISGTVTEAGSATGLDDIDLTIYDAKGNFVRSASTDANGDYEARRLPSGSYRASTIFSHPYVDEVWDNVSCYGAPNGCEATDGALITVTAPKATTGIDFALVTGGAISGTVTEQGTATPLPNITIEFFSATGEYLGGDTTSGAGSWQVSGLPSGSYRVQTFGSAPHEDELYNGMYCPGGYCDVVPGTPVAVTAPATTSGIDFVLPIGGAISGTVTQDGTSAPLQGVRVMAFDVAGKKAGSDKTAADGSYTVGGLFTGSYYVSTVDAPSHVDELHAGIPCPGGGGFGCSATTGSAIVVTAPGVVTGIDFGLAAGGSIQGSVLDAVTLLPLGGIDPEVKIYSATGVMLTTTETDGAGNYSTSGLPTGTYFARVTNSSGYRNLRYDGLSCADSCDPELGTPIVVNFPANTTGIDFRLYQPGAEPDLVLSKEDLSAQASFCAQISLTVGPDFEVQDPAVVSFLSNKVVFGPDFSAVTGTKVTVGGNPPLVCDD